MTVTPEDVRGLSLSGEFSHNPPFSDSVIQKRITRAELFVDTTLGGDIADPAVTALAAHFLVMDTQAGTSARGPVSSEKVGEVAVTYGGPPGFTELQTTSYGRQYIELMELIPALGTTTFPSTSREIC